MQGMEKWYALLHACEGTRTRWQFSLMAQRTNLVRALLDGKADPNVELGDSKVTPAYKAAKFGRAEVLALLLEAKASVNASTSDGQSLLFAAASQNHVDCVEVLLKFKGVFAEPKTLLKSLCDTEITVTLRASPFATGWSTHVVFPTIINPVGKKVRFNI